MGPRSDLYPRICSIRMLTFGTKMTALIVCCFAVESDLRSSGLEISGALWSRDLRGNPNTMQQHSCASHGPDDQTGTSNFIIELLMLRLQAQ